jgi:hypothetical protein
MYSNFEKSGMMIVLLRPKEVGVMIELNDHPLDLPIIESLDLFVFGDPFGDIGITLGLTILNNDYDSFPIITSTYPCF